MESPTTLWASHPANPPAPYVRHGAERVAGIEPVISGVETQGPTIRPYSRSPLRDGAGDGSRTRWILLTMQASLLRNITGAVEAEGVGPSSVACKATALPLSYAPGVESTGFGPACPACRAGRIPSYATTPLGGGAGSRTPMRVRARDGPIPMDTPVTAGRPAAADPEGIEPSSAGLEPALRPSLGPISARDRLRSDLIP